MVASALACAVVVLGFFAVSPTAHACIHEHHDAADHDCVIKHFAHGKLLLPVVDAPLPDALLAEGIAPAPLVSVSLPQVPHRLPAGRAPPTV